MNWYGLLHVWVYRVLHCCTSEIATFLNAPCLSASVRCTPVASLVDNFVDISSPILENFFYTSHKEILSPCDFWKKWWFPLKQSIFSIVLGLRNNSATWFMRFRYKSFAMDTWYLVSLVTHLNWPGFLENFSAPSSLQQSQVKSSANKRELKWPSLW